VLVFFHGSLSNAGMENPFNETYSRVLRHTTLAIRASTFGFASRKLRFTRNRWLQRIIFAFATLIAITHRGSDSLKSIRGSRQADSRVSRSALRGRRNEWRLKNSRNCNRTSASRSHLLSRNFAALRGDSIPVERSVRNRQDVNYAGT